MLYILILNALTGVISCVSDAMGITSSTMDVVREISRYVYFFTHTALCPLLYFYVSSVIGKSMREDKKSTLLKASFFFFAEILVFLNPFIHSVWYMDEANVFHRNWGEYIIYGVAAVYYLLTLFMLLFSWKTISKKRKVSMVFFFITTLIGVFLQLFIKGLRVEVLFEIIGFTGAMMSIENEDDRINASIGVYNRQALMMDLEAALKNYRHLNILIVRVANKDIVSRMTGSENINAIYVQVSQFLKSVVPRYSVYAASPGDFMLLLYHKNKEETNNIVRQIDDRFKENWKVGEVEIPLNVVQMLTEIPKRITSVDDALYMIDAPLPKDIEKSVLEESDLDYLLRRAAVESAVMRGLEEGSFDVYYQPTYHLDGTLHGAEALLRMHDKELGDVYPDEFIPVAEQVGLISDIDDFVLHEVCRFIKSGIPKANGMDGINVNLSMLQCMKRGFVGHINKLVEEEGVDKGFINFEITESVAATDYKTVSHVVRDLKKEGFLFSMDDYGTGYSNMNAIFSLNLDVIKIDKSILWSAEKKETGAIILENSVNMIRQMKKKILVEGVETEAQLNRLRELKVDYLQGYYFSKPVPKDEFIRLIEGK